jgi:hypothetical protein
MNLIGNINAIPFRRFRGGGGVSPIPPFPSISGMIARYSALGLTNEQMAANPVWVDKTGNGHDLQMKNLAWGGMSGVNGYKFNFLSNEWVIDNNQVSEKYSYKIVINDKKNSVQFYRINSEHIKIILKITGIEINKSTFRVYDNAGTEHAQNYTKDGIYEIDYTANEGANMIYFYVFGGNTGQLENPITIEQLPLYPGALVFDGVDDYGTCNNFPILTKEKGYTVVVLRQWITRGEIAQGLVSNVKNWLKDGAFLLEYRNIQTDHLNKPISFGAIGSENDLPHIFTYQTSKSYNGVSITTGNFEGTDVLHVGKLAPTNVGTCINAAIWELVFLDHDATEEELTKIKDYFVKTYPWLFPYQAWTVTGKTNEDEDRATIANITGNGNDLVLSNFGFAEGSGYNEQGEYAGYLVTDGVDDKIESKQPFQLPIKFSMIGSWVFIKKEDKRAGISKENNLIVYDKITGLTLFLNSVESYEEIDIDSFHAISSDGKLYDENWNMLPITVGSLLSDSSTLKIAYDGNNFVQFAFNCMGFYDKILKKDDLLKGWIYLKGLKAQRIPPSKNYILKEDGGYVLQEDGNKILTEQQ